MPVLAYTFYSLRYYRLAASQRNIYRTNLIHLMNGHMYARVRTRVNAQRGHTVYYSETEYYCHTFYLEPGHILTCIHDNLLQSG